MREIDSRRKRSQEITAKESTVEGTTPPLRQWQQPYQPPRSQLQNPQINLFKLFLDAGCGPADSIDYAALSPQEQVDETTLESFTESKLRSLGLREGDILRVLKAIKKRAPHHEAGPARKEHIREGTDVLQAFSPWSNLQVGGPSSTSEDQPLALQAPPDPLVPGHTPTVAPMNSPATNSYSQTLATTTTVATSQPTSSHFNAFDNAGRLESEQQAQPPSVLIQRQHKQSLPPPLLPKLNTPPATAMNPDISSLMSVPEIISVLTAHGCEDITSHLDLSSCSSFPLSSGGFGDVYRGSLNGGVQVAIKTMRIHLVSSEEGRKPLKDAARELHTWSKCRHPSVLKLLGVVQFRDQIGMVAEWMEHGNLTSYIMRRPTANRCQLCISICDGLSYLHGIGIIHGDLKGLNVLVTNDGTAVLTDFGNAVLQGRTLQFTATTAKSIMSPRWAAPELIEGTSTCTTATDVYALGMETITGNVPYAERSDHAVYYAVAVKKEPPTRPEDHIPSHSPHGDTLWSLLTKCWAYTSTDRPNATKIRETVIIENRHVCKLELTPWTTDENSHRGRAKVS
ncbi:hypothetical protein FRC12_008356 [Ceratobasidium sp. 428]|nr:hypothetical protein FRC12_008356 [Ceratobasidium sp. 428]